MIKRRRSPLSLAAVGASSLLLLTGILFTAERANAYLEDVTENGEQGLLSLRADPHPFHWQNPQPGEEKYWLIEASLADAEEGSLSLEMRADGDLVTASGITAAITECSVPFTGSDGLDAQPECSGDITEVLPSTPISTMAGPQEGKTFPMMRILEGEPRNLLVTLGVPEDAQVPDGSATFAVRFHASGDSAVPLEEEPNDLAQTGSNALALTLLAVGVIGLGLSVRWFRVGSSASDREA